MNHLLCHYVLRMSALAGAVSQAEYREAQVARGLGGAVWGTWLVGSRGDHQEAIGAVDHTWTVDLLSFLPC